MSRKSRAALSLTLRNEFTVAAKSATKALGNFRGAGNRWMGRGALKRFLKQTSESYFRNSLLNSLVTVERVSSSESERESFGASARVLSARDSFVIQSTTLN